MAGGLRGNESGRDRSRARKLSSAMMECQREQSSTEEKSQSRET